MYVDSMVNNAGIVRELAAVHEVNEDDYDAIMQINAKGTFLGIKYAAKQMLNQDVINENGDRGWIVNIGSIYSSVASPGICMSLSFSVIP